MSNDSMESSELIRLLKLSLCMTKLKPAKKPFPVVTDASNPETTEEQAEQHYAAMLERLRIFKDTHDELPFGSDQRNDWLLLAFQELVRDAVPFMRGISSITQGVRKEVCEEWVMVQARLMRRGLVE